MFIMIWAHIMACLYFTIAQFQIILLDDNLTWIDNAGIRYDDFFGQYRHSFFVASSSMITVLVYPPQTDIEITFVAIIMIFNCGFFGYSINSLGIIMQEITRQTDSQEREINILMDFMVHKQIQKDLILRTKNYLQYVHQQEQDKQSQELKNIIPKLSQKLQEELVYQANRKYVEFLDTIIKHFPKDIQEIFISIMEEKMYCPGEIIYESQNNNNKGQNYGVNILIKGQIVYIQKLSEICQLQPGQMFGLDTFFTGIEKQDYIMKAVKYSNVIYIDRQKFMQAVKKIRNKEVQQQSIEIFFNIKDKLIFQKNCQELEQTCNICELKTHLVYNCDKIQYNPNVQELIQNQQQASYQERSQYYRDSIHIDFKYPLLSQEMIEDSMVYYMNKNTEFLAQYEIDNYLNKYDCLLEYFLSIHLDEHKQFLSNYYPDDDKLNYKQTMSMSFSKQQKPKFLNSEITSSNNIHINSSNNIHSTIKNNTSTIKNNNPSNNTIKTIKNEKYRKRLSSLVLRQSAAQQLQQDIINNVNKNNLEKSTSIKRSKELSIIDDNDEEAQTQLQGTNQNSLNQLNEEQQKQDDLEQNNYVIDPNLRLSQSNRFQTIKPSQFNQSSSSLNINLNGNNTNNNTNIHGINVNSSLINNLIGPGHNCNINNVQINNNMNNSVVNSLIGNNVSNQNNNFNVNTSSNSQNISNQIGGNSSYDQNENNTISPSTSIYKDLKSIDSSEYKRAMMNNMQSPDKKYKYKQQFNFQQVQNSSSNNTNSQGINQSSSNSINFQRGRSSSYSKNPTIVLEQNASNSNNRIRQLKPYQQLKIQKQSKQHNSLSNIDQLSPNLNSPVKSYKSKKYAQYSFTNFQSCNQFDNNFSPTTVFSPQKLRQQLPNIRRNNQKKLSLLINNNNKNNNTGLKKSSNQLDISIYEDLKSFKSLKSMKSMKTQNEINLINYEKEEKKIFIISDFDVFKEYQFYLPHNNLSYVLENNIYINNQKISGIINSKDQKQYIGKIQKIKEQIKRRKQSSQIKGYKTKQQLDSEGSNQNIKSNDIQQRVKSLSITLEEDIKLEQSKKYKKNKNK